jgi:hypothetical protein
VATKRATVEREVRIEVITISPWGRSVLLSVDGKLYNLAAHDRIDLKMKTELSNQ